MATEDRENWRHVVDKSCRSEALWSR